MGKAQVVVNPDGTHSVVVGNVVVNPDGTHSVIAGNVIVNSNGTHSVIVGNTLVNPDGSHSAIPAVLKSVDASKCKAAPRSTHRKSDLKSINKLSGKGCNKKKDFDTNKVSNPSTLPKK